jgi:hypothetical protein
MARLGLAIATGGALLLLSAPAAAQGLLQKITAVADGDVRMSFAAREDVCGDGINNIRFGRRHRTDRDDDTVIFDDGDCTCEQGPVRVRFHLSDHQVTRVRTWVGGEWRSTAGGTDLGMVSTRQAVAALLALANDRRHSGGEDAVFPATLADSQSVWPELLKLARNESAPHDSRKQAVFWVSQAASDSATAGLSQLAESDHEDDEIRKQAVFGLSQRPREEGVPALIKVARTSTNAEVRRSALFWLGQTEDPRALALFEEILTKN